MCIMGTKVFILLSWTILLLSSSCESGTQKNNEKITTIIMETTETTTAITDTTMISEDTEIMESPNVFYETPLVLCQCGPDEVMDDTGQCQHWMDGTTVVMESNLEAKINHESYHFDTSKFLNYTIVNKTCEYHYIELQEDEFVLRLRGDLLVSDGTLRGLRVGDQEYCIHHEQKGDQVKVTARGCVFVPKIQRCCPPGERMVNGDCVRKSTTLMLFDPPLSTGPHGNENLAGAAFPWASHQQQVNKPSCSSEHVLKNVKLDGHKSYLAVLPQSLLLTYELKRHERQWIFPPDYCVDVLEDDDSYYAYSCQMDWDTICKNNTCIRKCCPDGQIFSSVNDGCSFSDLTFNHPFPNPPRILNNSVPSCVYFTHIFDFQLLEDGTLVHNNNEYSFDKFCTDTFIVDNANKEGAMACLKEIQPTTWRNVRGVLLPVCDGISCTFLALLLLLYGWIPKLSDKEGKYQFFHAASLFLGISANFVMVVAPREYTERPTSNGFCFTLAFLMQFGHLSSFFWLNIMCFDVWRLFRNLVTNMYSPTRPVAPWIYLLYAFVGPVTITVVTIIVQFTVPIDVQGLVHPRIGEYNCWFLVGGIARGEMGLLAYYYGPISVLFFLNFIFICWTYYYLKVIRGDFKSADDQSGYKISSAETTRKVDFFAAFWQRFYLLALVAGCWMTEVLSAIPPEELWAVTDILNHLQGIFVLVAFFTNHNKRALLKKKLPKIFQLCESCINHAKTAKIKVNQVARQTSSSFNTNDNEISLNNSSTGITPLQSQRLDSNSHPETSLS